MFLIIMFHFLLPAQKLSMTRGRVGLLSKRLMAPGDMTRAMRPSFGALTTAWAALGLRFFVKM